MNAISPAPTGTAGLAGLVRDTAISGVGRRVLLVRFDHLAPHRIPPLRAVRGALDPLIHADRGQLFHLGKAVAVAWRGAHDAALDVAQVAMRPLLGGQRHETMRMFALPAEGTALLDAIERLAATRLAPEAVAMPLDPATLAGLEAALARADVASFARRRPICAPAPGGRFRRAWEQRILAVDAIGATLAPEHALAADPWLFLRLTRTFDRRMLALLAAPNELRDAGPFGLDLAVESLVCPEFLRFDAALPTALRGRVVLGLLPSDVLADGPAFLFARDFARARGYRLLLRGLTPALLPVLAPMAAGFHHLELPWSPALAALDPGALPVGRVVLTGVDSDPALAWGTERGIGLFAGKLIRA